MPSTDPQPIAVPPGTGKLLKFLGIRHTLTTRQTGGSCYFFEGEFGPGDGSRLHVHRDDVEFAYVVEGSLAVRLGEETLEVDAGGVAFLPQGIPHALRNPLATTSRYLFAAIPGRSLEEYFVAVEAAGKVGSLNKNVQQELGLQFGLEWLE
jgi:quercetin dioxygenase-like cupin family protein